jgi:hypothetical protein
MTQADLASPIGATKSPMSGTREAKLSRWIVYAVAFSLVLAAPLVWRLYWPASGGLDMTGHQIGRDFINAWAGPLLAFGGQLPLLFDPAGYQAAISALFGAPLPPHAWSYPLFCLLLFWPLAQLPYFVALGLWTFGLFAAFAAMTLSQIERAMRPLALILLVLAPATLINVFSGQNGFLTACLLIGGVLLLDRRPVLAGILFGALTYKPHLGLIVPFVLLAIGAWRAIVAATATASLLVAASVAAFGLEAWRSYFEVTSAMQLRVLGQFHDFGPMMVTSVMVGVARTFGVSLQTAFTAQIGVAIPVIAVAMWAVRQTTDPATRAFVVVAATLLATPYAMVYDFPALTAVMAWRLCGPQPLGLVRGAIMLAAWLAPLGSIYLSSIGLGIAPLALIGVFAIAVGDALAGTARLPRWGFRRAPSLSGPSAAPAR